MSDHIPEHTLELLILTPEEISSAEKEAIGLHLSECALCGEYWQRLTAFYASVNKSLNESPTQRDAEFAEELLARPERLSLPERGLVRQETSLRETIESYAEVIEPYRRSAVQRFVQWARFNPVKFAGATTFAIAALAMLTMTMKTPRDTNPTFADVKNGVLSVYNKEGKTIWTKAAFGIPDWEYPLPFQRTDEFVSRYVGIEDIDGTGKNVVLVTGDRDGWPFAKDTLYCFEGDGTLRWRVYAGDPILFGDKTWATQAGWRINEFFTLRDTDSSKPRLFVLAASLQFFPSRVFEIDPADGRELSCYLHAGSLNAVSVADVNGDRRPEILLGGVSRSYLQANLIVLDPSNINGYGVCAPDFSVANIPKAREMYYILFPETDVSMTGSNNPFNMTNRILIGAKGYLQIFVDEIPGGAKNRARLIYSVGPNMKAEGAVGNSFDTAHENLKKEGKISSTLDEAYTANLLNSIQYWDGEKVREHADDEQAICGISSSSLSVT